MEIVNHDSLYAELLKIEVDKLKEEYDQVLLEHPDHFELEVLTKFIHNKDEACTCRFLNESNCDFDATLISKMVNQYKEDLFESWERKGRKYKRNLVSNFIKFDVSELKEYHLQKIQEGNNSEDYTWESEFIHDSSSKDILKMFAQYYSTDIFIEQHPLRESYTSQPIKFGKKSILEKREETIKKGLVKWTNGKNKTDFVKIIYGMYHAGLINNGDGEITKIVPYLGEIFNVELSKKSWEGNHTTHKTNARMSPEQKLLVFDKIKDAYRKYLEKNEQI